MLVIAVLALSGVSASAVAQDAVSQPAERGIAVTVDPRIELLAVVQYTSGYGGRADRLLTRHEFPYKQHIQLQFSTYRDHPVMELFNRMSQQGFSFDAPVAAILHYSPPPAFEPISTVPDDIAARAGGREALAAFMEALRDFCRTSYFTEFFKEHGDFYAEMITAVESTIEAVDVSLLEAYYGIKQGSYNIVLAPLFHPGGYGPRVMSEDGSYDIYSVNGPLQVVNDTVTFGTVADFRYLVWHEFSHSFTNPLVDQYAERIDACAALFEPVREIMSRQAYRSWRTCAYEHIVRAVTCRFAAIAGGMQAGLDALREETGRGFHHVPALCEALREYEAHRDQYPTFADFFPQLVAVFEKAVAELDAREAVSRDADNPASDTALTCWR